MENIEGRYREAVKFLSSKGGHYLKHPKLSGKPSYLFDSDGVHLSELGNNTLLDNVHDALEHLLDCAGVGFLA